MSRWKETDVSQLRIMPIAPILDDRRYEELVNEIKTRVPRYAPEWTDYNDSDLGVSMLQSVSWIAATAEATRRLDTCAGDELKQFLRLAARLSAKPSPAILCRMRAMRIEEWSPAKEPQVLAFLVSRLCPMPSSTGTKPHRRNLKEVERNVAAFLYCRHRLSDMMSEE
jgi:hypothetical protein